LFLNFALIKYLTPRPNPLPAGGERGLEGIFYFKDRDYFNFIFSLRNYRPYSLSPPAGRGLG